MLLTREGFLNTSVCSKLLISYFVKQQLEENGNAPLMLETVNHIHSSNKMQKWYPLLNLSDGENGT